MSVADLHPEELLDKEIRGQLEPAERERLEAHLTACATCRMERRMRADFALELSAEGLAPGVARVVESVARQSASPPPRQDLRRARRFRTILLAAAATLTVVVGAFASTETGRRVLAPLFTRTADSSSPETEVAPTRARSDRPHEQASAPPQPSDALSVIAVPPEPPPAPQTSALPPRPSVPDGAATLFDAETDARRKGDLTRVLELHAELVARFPSSDETRVSRMVVARMLLDRGDAAGALGGFDAYLRAGSGELREEALAGRATALDRLGRTDEARRAWVTLVDEYPATPYGAHARARIEAPGGN